MNLRQLAIYAESPFANSNQSSTMVTKKQILTNNRREPSAHQ